MATEGRILTPADVSGGNPVRTVLATTQATDEGAPSQKDQQVVSIANPDGTLGIFRFDGAQRLAMDPTSLFHDPVEGTLDTQMWATGGTAPTISNGTYTFPVTVSTSSRLVSVPTFLPGSSAYLVPAFITTLEAAVGTGMGRFWGWASPNAAQSTTSLATSGVGFEVEAASGALQAVTYAAGVKTVVATLAKPTDGLPHRYFLHARSARVVWYIDTWEWPVASVAMPNVPTWNVGLLVSSTTAASVANGPTFGVSSIGMGDSSRNNVAISDGKYPWRELAIDTQGAAMMRREPMTTGVVTRVTQAAANTATTLLAASTDRRVAKVYNDSAQVLRLAEGQAATATVYTVALDPGAYYETDFDGLISGIWPAANGSCNVTSLS